MSKNIFIHSVVDCCIWSCDPVWSTSRMPDNVGGDRQIHSDKSSFCLFRTLQRKAVQSSPALSGTIVLGLDESEPGV